MRLLIKYMLAVTIALLLSGYTGGWKDQTEQVGATTVKTVNAGPDDEAISYLHGSEAIKLGEFVKTYNIIAYKQGSSQAELCQALEQEAVVAIEQSEKTFHDMYEVKCLPDKTDLAPGLKMIIYPKAYNGYRFEITFKPTQ